MDIKLINVGYGNFISSSRIIAIIGPESAPVKRMIQEAREERRLIDATYGRRTRAVIIRQRPCDFIRGSAGNDCASL